jgi:acetyltransferase-like isoleucine patch superfamily enzyme
VTGSLARRLFQRLTHLYGVRPNVRIGIDVHIGVGSILSAPTELTIADHVYVGKFCTVQCDGEIGRYVMLANNVGLIGRYDHDHRCIGKPIRNAPWIGDPEYQGAGKGLRIVVGDDVWIGFGAIVLTGVTIGRGAIIAAGTVVTSDVAPYSIVAGNPGRAVGTRFTGEEIAAHELAMERSPTK